ncbi:universal stress protein [Desulfobaculum bizertense]|uniref:Universal stress protein n=1 Tax=Desulfobaculum bizertense DSM 18034 TaxID=1121442 RepID=A0A1T4WUR4_9BACT|nr:universal stress protein [Desulfobaculum bizertense]UIJ37231.1 universal stress protein [Desulfobaculum bizertense]SKA80371.1 Nucleotide-binding universal stress protein, UspA family [Desulfobaculum bizertense DSM 18034]
MRQIKKILCAVDFSDYSPRVAEYARLMAEKFDAEITVVYIAPSLNQYVGFHVPPSSIENFVGEIVSGAESTMDHFIEKNFKGLTVSGRVGTGYAAEEILQAALDDSADLIIIGTHGRKGIDRILFGSVAEKVVKGSLCPVLTVRPGDE